MPVLTNFKSFLKRIYFLKNNTIHNNLFNNKIMDKFIKTEKLDDDPLSQTTA